MPDSLIISREHAFVTLENEEEFLSVQKRNLNLIKECHPSQLQVRLGYIAGVDWIIPGKKAIYVAPKLDGNEAETNYLLMLLTCFRHKDVLDHTKDLFSIDFDSPVIRIQQKKDNLSPLLIVQYLQTVKFIVQKGLKKSYYKIQKNLHARIKGKILVGKTIKQNTLKNKLLYTFCSYDEFGVDSFENRLLKKALLFIRRYLNIIDIPGCRQQMVELFNFILPAFDHVSDKVDLNDVKQVNQNVFFQEYAQAIRLAKLILKRFGYNLSKINSEEETEVPPFWINMAKLFELFVLGMLKDRFGPLVTYHFYRERNELDYLLKGSYNLVIDAKYKNIYSSNNYDMEDIRQIAGYARLEEVYKELSLDNSKVIDCLIIYPDKNGHSNIDNKLTTTPINNFVNFYKYSVRLPVI